MLFFVDCQLFDVLLELILGSLAVSQFILHEFQSLSATHLVYLLLQPLNVLLLLVNLLVDALELVLFELEYVSWVLPLALSRGQRIVKWTDAACVGSSGQVATSYLQILVTCPF